MQIKCKWFIASQETLLIVIAISFRGMEAALLALAIRSLLWADSVVLVCLRQHMNIALSLV